MDPFAFEHEIRGHFRDGRDEREATILVNRDGIVARAGDGREVQVPWSGVKLERGGDEREVLYAHAPGKGLAVFSSDPEFARAVEGIGGNEVVDQLARLSGESVTSRRAHYITCGVFLVLTVVLTVAFFRSCVGAIVGLGEQTVESVVAQIPYETDERIGEVVAGSMQLGEEVTNPVVVGAVEEILARLAPHASLPEAEFQVRVVESPEVNAFALPGGYLTVFTGLMRAAEEPEQVAGVLAHEMAHVTERHGLKRIAQHVGLTAIIELTVGDAEGLAGIAKEFFTLAAVNNYSQAQESEADAEGVRILHEAGLDPLAVADFFALLQRESGGAAEPPVSWMSGHPAHGERIAAIHELVTELPAGVERAPLDVDWAAVQAALGD